MIIGDPRKDKTTICSAHTPDSSSRCRAATSRPRTSARRVATWTSSREHTRSSPDTSSRVGRPVGRDRMGRLLRDAHDRDSVSGDADSLEGRHVAHPGRRQGRLVHRRTSCGRRLPSDSGGHLRGSASAKRRATSCGASSSPDEIHAVDCDIFSPCALSGELNSTTVPDMRCAAIVGCANNQLADPSQADALAKRKSSTAPTSS